MTPFRANKMISNLWNQCSQVVSTCFKAGKPLLHDVCFQNFLRVSGIFLDLFLFFNTSAAAEEHKEKKKTVCLNMIVKNERHVMERGLTRLKPIIDHWIIVDTGSTDGTQQKIRELMKDVPGELYERPWKNFEHNRNEALALAKGKADYVLIMDADDTLEFDSNFKMPDLQADSYMVQILHGGSQYDRPLLIKDTLNWKWKGVLHEYLSCPQARSSERLAHVCMRFGGDGARSKDPLKFQKDAQVLEAALKEEPNNDRYVFYLAQSYKDAGDPASALKNYERRASMGGWDQEVFYSMLQIGKMQEILKMPPESFEKSYYAAYRYRPSRAEPLYYLAHHYRDEKDFAKGYKAAKIAMSIPLPKDILFVEKWIYDYGAMLECSINAYWIDKFEECQQLSLKLLSQADLPQNVRDVVQRNLEFANLKLVEHLGK